MYKKVYDKIVIENEPVLEKDVKYLFASTHSFSDDIGLLLAASKYHLILFTNTLDQLEHNPEFFLI